MMNHATDHRPLLSGAQVAVRLLLCEPDDCPDDITRAVRAVHKLVRDGKLRPIKPGRRYVFAPAEVDRYVRDETEAFELKAAENEVAH